MQSMCPDVNLIKLLICACPLIIPLVQNMFANTVNNLVTVILNWWRNGLAGEGTYFQQADRTGPGTTVLLRP